MIPGKQARMRRLIAIAKYGVFIPGVNVPKGYTYWNEKMKKCEVCGREKQSHKEEDKCFK